MTQQSRIYNFMIYNDFCPHPSMFIFLINCQKKKYHAVVINESRLSYEVKCRPLVDSVILASPFIVSGCSRPEHIRVFPKCLDEIRL